MKQILGAFFIMLLFSSFTFAEEDNFIEDLDLSREQVEQIQTRQRETNTIRVQLKEQIQTKEKKLKQELGKTEANQERIRELKQELNQLQAKQLDNDIDGFMEMKKVMTKEQLKKIEKIQIKSGYKNMTQSKENGTGSGSGRRGSGR